MMLDKSLLELTSDHKPGAELVLENPDKSWVSAVIDEEDPDLNDDIRHAVGIAGRKSHIVLINGKNGPERIPVDRLGAQGFGLVSITRAPGAPEPDEPEPDSGPKFGM